MSIIQDKFKKLETEMLKANEPEQFLLSQDYFIKLGEMGFSFADYELWLESALTLGNIGEVVDRSMGTDYRLSCDYFNKFEKLKRRCAYIMKKTGWFIWAQNEVVIFRDSILDSMDDEIDFQCIRFSGYRIIEEEHNRCNIKLLSEKHDPITVSVPLEDSPFILSALETLSKYLDKIRYLERRSMFLLSNG